MKKKTVNKWLDYPKYQPELWEEIVAKYGETGQKEILFWKLKYVGKEINFKWLRLPPNELNTKQ